MPKSETRVDVLGNYIYKARSIANGHAAHISKDSEIRKIGQKRKENVRIVNRC